jgi:REP element-mobilizing transposase RayT
VFRDEGDRRHFEERLGEMVSRYGVKVHAYVLMDNHYHLLLQTPEANASRALHWLNVSYSVWFNRRHNRSGPLFQGRFKSVPVDGEGSWGLELSAYMHLNPVRIKGLGLGKRERAAERAGMAQEAVQDLVQERLRTLREHRWSSYGAYGGYGRKPAWLSCEDLWGRAKRAGLDGKTSYRHYVEERLTQGVREGGMERLTAALVIGSVKFAEGMRRLATGDRRTQPALRQWHRLLSFERVKAAVEGVKGAKWAAFCDRRGDWGRDVALWLGRKHCGLTVKELGDQVGADYRAASKAILRMQARLVTDLPLRKTVEQIERSLSHVAT